VAPILLIFLKIKLTKKLCIFLTGNTLGGGERPYTPPVVHTLLTLYVYATACASSARSKILNLPLEFGRHLV